MANVNYTIYKYFVEDVEKTKFKTTPPAKLIGEKGYLTNLDYNDSTGVLTATVLNNDDVSTYIPAIFWDSVTSGIEYSGGDVYIPNGSLDVSGYIDVGIFTDGNEPAHQRGRIFYSDEEEALAYYNDEADIQESIGRELLMRVKNVEGTTIYNGDVVYVYSATGSNPTVKLAKANNLSTARMIGMVTQSSISNNVVGYVTTFGRVYNLDTSSFSAGDDLYISPSTAGEITNTKPTQPDHSFRVGTVIRSHSSEGIIFIDPDREINNFTSDSIIFADSNGELSESTGLTFNGWTFNLNGIQNISAGIPKLSLIDNDSTNTDSLRFEIYNRELRLVPVEDGTSLWNSRLQYEYADDVWHSLTDIKPRHILMPDFNAVKFLDSNISGVATTIYQSAGNFLTVRNYANDYTLQSIRSKAGDPTSADREATLAFVRTDDSGNEEFFDIYNNGYHTSGDVNHGIRIQKRGSGNYRPFAFEFSDGNTITKSMEISYDDGIEVENTTFKDGDVTISGNLLVNGEKVQVNTSVLAQDNMLMLNKGEVGTGITNTWGGLEFDRGSADPYRLGYNENTDLVEVGIYYITLNYSSLSGTFQNFEEVVGQDSSASGYIIRDDGSGSMDVKGVEGSFDAAGGEKIVGQTSSAYASLSSKSTYDDTEILATRPWSTLQNVTDQGNSTDNVVQITGRNTTPTGVGIELDYYPTGDYGRILSYSRDASTFKEFRIQGDPIVLKNGNVNITDGNLFAYKEIVLTQDDGGEDPKLQIDKDNTNNRFRIIQAGTDFSSWDTEIGRNGYNVYINSNTYIDYGNLNITDGNLQVDGEGDSYIQGSLGLGGITSPAEALDVNGNTQISNNVSNDFTNFVSGFAGSNWAIRDKGSNTWQLDVDSAYIRGALYANEFIINQITAINGSDILSPGRGKISSVSGTASSETVTVEDPQGNNVVSFAVDDIILCQTVQPDNNQIVKQLVRKVSSISSNDVTFTSLSDAPSDSGSFAEGDVIVTIGNTSDTSRQSSIYRTSVDSNNPYTLIQDGVDSWTAWKSSSKTKMKYGNLNGSYGYTSNEYGIAAGNPSGDHFTVDTTNGVRFLDDSNNIAAQLSSNIFKIGDSTNYVLYNANTASFNAVIDTFTLNANSGDLKIDSTNKIISINNSTFASSGIQLDYNSGSPRFYAGDGTTNYISYNGTSVDVSANSYTFDANSGDLKIDSAAKSISINSSSFGTGGIQLQFNSGLPRFYVGDGGPNNYIKYDGTDVGISAKTFALNTNSGDLKIDSGSKIISLNDSTFGAKGIQLDHNSGSPRAYIGDGATNYISFDGTSVDVSANSYTFDANSGDLKIDSFAKLISINSKEIQLGHNIGSDNIRGLTVDGETRGSRGIQLGRYTENTVDFTWFYAGNGGTNYLKYDGGLVSISSSSFTLNADSGDLKIDSGSKSIAINDTTFGNTGIQLQYNGGSPQFFVGDSNNYLKYQGGTTEVQGTLRTNDSGKRVELSSLNSNLNFYDSSGNIAVAIDDDTFYNSSPGVGVYANKSDLNTDYCEMNSTYISAMNADGNIEMGRGTLTFTNNTYANEIVFDNSDSQSDLRIKFYGLPITPGNAGELYNESGYLRIS